MDINDLTIGDIVERTGLPASTLRYYEREGLVLRVDRDEAGRRSYRPDDLAWVEFLTRLRATGMPVRDMKRFARLRAEGEATISERRELLESYRLSVLARVEELRRALEAIDEKIETYQRMETANDR